tara:strand:+ start:916 stop:1224 length:309 start_codon:yes stop_codon:yes gene_type:complete
MTINRHGTVLYIDANEAKEKLTPHVKAEAAKRILALMPDWKQRNTIADLSSDNADTKAAAVTAWAAVVAIRTKSNEVEASIGSMSDEEILNFDASDDAHWSG